MRAIVWLALCLPAAPALAQQGPPGSTCDVQIDSSRHSQFHLVGAVYETFAGGGVWAHCKEQPTTMYSDSVAWYPERNLLYLLGRVRFQDSVSLLDADRVTYYLQQERLFGEGNVYTKNLHTRSDMRGPNLDYYRVAPPLRDTAETVGRQRPTIHFYSAPSGEAADSGEPFVVVADRVRMRGNDQMWGGGNLTIDRSDLAAAGDSGQLDLGRNVGLLLGRPQVNGTGNDAYHLKGERITFTLTPTHQIRYVRSSDSAAARGPDWHLDADTLDLTLDSGKVQRAQAWGHGRQPVAVSGTQTIVADSLDIHMPAQLVRLVWAWRNALMVTRDTLAIAAAARRRAASDTAGRGAAGDSATHRVPASDTAGRRGAAGDSATHRVPASDAASHGARVAADTTARHAPVTDIVLAAALSDEADWLMGDSLRANFAVRRDSATTKPKSDLEHLTSFGSARTLYHVESADSARVNGRRGVNYCRGSRIETATRNSKVQTVDVVGQTDCVYLEPAPSAADSARARSSDSTRAASADTARARATDSTRAQPADTTHAPAADTTAHPAPAQRTPAYPKRVPPSAPPSPPPSGQP